MLKKEPEEIKMYLLLPQSLFNYDHYNKNNKIIMKHPYSCTYNNTHLQMIISVSTTSQILIKTNNKQTSKKLPHVHI